MLRTTLHAVIASAAVIVLAVPAPATSCRKADGCWQSRTELTEWTGTPTVVCLIGHPVVRIESSASCQGSNAGPAVALRCGVTSDSFSYSGDHGTTHTVGTTSDWETVLGGSCADLTYAVN